jgi:hypothetical protein
MAQPGEFAGEAPRAALVAAAVKRLAGVEEKTDRHAWDYGRIGNSAASSRVWGFAVAAVYDRRWTINSFSLSSAVIDRRLSIAFALR